MNTFHQEFLQSSVSTSRVHVHDVHAFSKLQLTFSSHLRTSNSSVKFGSAVEKSSRTFEPLLYLGFWIFENGDPFADKRMFESIFRSGLRSLLLSESIEGSSKRRLSKKKKGHHHKSSSSFGTQLFGPKVLSSKGRKSYFLEESCWKRREELHAKKGMLSRMKLKSKGSVRLNQIWASSSQRFIPFRLRSTSNSTERFHLVFVLSVLCSMFSQRCWRSMMANDRLHSLVFESRVSAK